MSEESERLTVAQQRVVDAMGRHGWRSRATASEPVTASLLDQRERDFGFAFPDELRAYFLHTHRSDGTEFSIGPHINREGVSWWSGSFELENVPWDTRGDAWYAAPGSGLFNPDRERKVFQQWLNDCAYPIGFRAHDHLFLDFAFDARNPPVVVISDEVGSRGRRIGYVASSLLTLLECPKITELDSYDQSMSDDEYWEAVDAAVDAAFKQGFRPSQRRTEWQAHRDANISPNNADFNQATDEGLGLAQ